MLTRQLTEQRLTVEMVSGQLTDLRHIVEYTWALVVHVVEQLVGGWVVVVGKCHRGRVEILCVLRCSKMAG